MKALGKACKEWYKQTLKLFPVQLFPDTKTDMSRSIPAAFRCKLMTIVGGLPAPQIVNNLAQGGSCL